MLFPLDEILQIFDVNIIPQSTCKNQLFFLGQSGKTRKKVNLHDFVLACFLVGNNHMDKCTPSKYMHEI